MRESLRDDQKRDTKMQEVRNGEQAGKQQHWAFSELNWHHCFVWEKMELLLFDLKNTQSSSSTEVRNEQKVAKLTKKTLEHWPRIWPKHKIPYLKSYLSNLFMCLMFKGTWSSLEYIWEGLKNSCQVHCLLKINSQSIILNQTFKDKPHNQVWTPKISVEQFIALCTCRQHEPRDCSKPAEFWQIFFYLFFIVYREKEGCQAIIDTRSTGFEP